MFYSILKKVLTLLLYDNFMMLIFIVYIFGNEKLKT